MDTTIQISKDLLNKLQLMKMHSKESYEDIIWDLLEDRMELSEETRKNIEEYKRDKKNRKLRSYKTLEQLKKELNL